MAADAAAAPVGLARMSPDGKGAMDGSTAPLARKSKHPGPISGDLGLHPGLGTRRRRCLFALTAGLFLCPAALFPHLTGTVFRRTATVVIGLTTG